MEVLTGSSSARDEIAQKHKLKIDLEASQFTFQPTLSARRGRTIDSKAAGSRFNRLYDDAMKRKNEGSKSKVEVDEYTFTPTLSTRTRVASRERNNSEFFDSMHKATGSGRSSKSEMQGDANLYKPIISKRASSLDRLSTLTAQNLRRMESDQRRQDAINKQKEEEDRRIAETCTFTPKIYSSRAGLRSKSVDSDRSTVSDRLQEYGERRKAWLEKEKQSKAKEEVADATFKPAVNLNKKISSQLQSGVDVYTRLSNPSEKSFDTVMTQADSELTFQPKPRRGSITSSIANETVHERLFREGEQRRKDLMDEKRTALSQRDAKCTFIPQTSHKASTISDSCSLDSDETPVFERLHGSRNFMEGLFEQIKFDLEMSECTFVPLITSKGRKATRRASEGPVHERLDKDAQLKKKEAERRLLERMNEEMVGATFHPQVPLSSQGIARRKTKVLDASSGDSSHPPLTVHRRLSITHTQSTAASVASAHFSPVTSPNRAQPPPEKATIDPTVERFLGARRHSDTSRVIWQERDKDDITEGQPANTALPNSNTAVKNEGAAGSSLTAHASPIPGAGAFRFGLAPRRLSLGSGKEVKEAEVSPSSIVSSETFSPKHSFAEKRPSGVQDFRGRNLDMSPSNTRVGQQSSRKVAVM